MVKLSLAIPTFNRDTCLTTLLNSIVKQNDERIEIVISDNASTDNTFEIVKTFQKEYSNIHYYRSETNVGFDRNCLKVCELSKGEYCWILGSDDKLEEGAIDFILKELSSYINGITLDYVYYDNTLQKPLPNPKLLFDLESEKFLDGKSCFKKIGLLLTYLSTHIFKKELWERSIPQNSEKYYPYIHFYLLTKIVSTYGNWNYCSNPYVGYRSNNSTCIEDFGFLKFLKQETFIMKNVVLDTFGNDKEIFKALYTQVCTSRLAWNILDLKLRNFPIKTNYQAFKICVNQYYKIPLFWFKIFPLFLIPNYFLILLRSIKKRIFS